MDLKNCSYNRCFSVCVYLLSNVGEIIRGFEDGFNAGRN